MMGKAVFHARGGFPFSRICGGLEEKGVSNIDSGGLTEAGG